MRGWARAVVALVIMAGMVALGPLSGIAFAQDRTERITFEAGRSGKTVRGAIVGYEGIDYLVRVRAGQRLAATLRTDNPSSYINIKARDAAEALFNGSIEGNLGDVIVPASGDYVVEVYLMRNAARRGERAQFTLAVEVTGGGAGIRQPDFADGLSGGPDFWEVANVPPGDRLNVRSRPSSQAPTVAQLRNGAVLRNLGCRMTGQTRWCRVERRDGSAAGWVAGRFLIESGGGIEGAETAPGTDPSPPIMDASVPQAARNACLREVRRTTNTPEIVILEMLYSEANSQLTLGVGPDRAPWQCLVSNSGVVASVMSLADEGRF